MPRWFWIALACLGALMLVPFACIARSRGVTSPAPRIHLIRDMDNQARFKSQQVNPLFADRRAMRPPAPGTVAQGSLLEDEALATGKESGVWTSTLPVPLTPGLLSKGRERFDIYCAPCHGLAGYGDGIVARRADRLQEGTWVPPTSLHTDVVRARTLGEIFNTITHGIRTMPAYGSQIPVSDRWAIVAYLKALQRSQWATLDDVPAEQRAGLR